jgi:hypothetical protein
LDLPTIPNAPVMSVRTPTFTGPASAAGAALSVPDEHAARTNKAATDDANAVLRRKRPSLNIFISFFSLFLFV